MTGPTSVLRRPWLPFAVAALLVAVALGLWVAAPGPSARDDVAVVDAGQTSRLVDVVTSGLESVFAYDYRDPERGQAAAKGFLTGRAVQDYRRLRSSVAGLGKKESLVYEVTVTGIGVQHLRGDRAEVLAFLKQVSTRGSDGAVQQAPAQLEVSLKRSEDTWQVTGFDLL